MEHRKVPGLARHPQSFTPDRLHPIQSPLSQPMIPAAQSESIDPEELAAEIYCRAVVRHLRSYEDYQPDRAALQRLAQIARAAAAAFCEGASHG